MRLPIGQLLVRMLRRFRAELLERMRAGYADARDAHMHVFGNIDWSGTRLTELAARAGMAPPSMAELVDELERAGYLERRPDPTDRRAKLICLTRSGRRVVTQALRAVREIERVYAAEVGADAFEALCQKLQALVDVPQVAGRTDRNGTLGAQSRSAPPPDSRQKPPTARLR